MVSFLEVPAGLDHSLVFWEVLASLEPCVPGEPWAKLALGQWSSGFKNHETHNGTVFQTSSMESWKD